MFRALILAGIASLGIHFGCSDDGAESPVNNPANNPSDLGTADMAKDSADDSGTPDVDSGGGDCIQATINGQWELTLADDVSVEYSAEISPEVEGAVRQVSVLFERYMPGADVGTFDLSQGGDNNFGTCAHCVFVRTDTAERAYFTESGILESTSDPYSRRADFSLSGLKLIEVTVNPLTRESTPVEGGGCVEFADFEVSGVFPPEEWTCPAETYGDGAQCNCGCGAYDPDCATGGDCLPGAPDCPEPVELPVVGCQESEVCTFDPVAASAECFETCDWAGRAGCTTGTCVFDSGANDGKDLCILDAIRIAPGVGIGEDCPSTGYQMVCNVNGGFAEGYCDPNDVCRALCNSNEECTEQGHTCQPFLFGESFGYCGPEPTDG